VARPEAPKDIASQIGDDSPFAKPVKQFPSSVPLPDQERLRDAFWRRSRTKSRPPTSGLLASFAMNMPARPH
jgi:hypothetical protein